MKKRLVLDKVKNHRADKINMITEKIKRWRHLSLCFIVSTLHSCVAGWLVASSAKWSGHRIWSETKYLNGSSLAESPWLCMPLPMDVRAHLVSIGGGGHDTLQWWLALALCHNVVTFSSLLDRLQFSLAILGCLDILNISLPSQWKEKYILPWNYPF